MRLKYWCKPILSFVILLLLLTAASVSWGREILVTSGDMITLKVDGEPEFSRSYLVDEEGNITLPEVGPFKVAGQTLTQLKDSLAKAISDYVKNPQVTVEMPSSSGKDMLVYGEVRRPGTVTVKLDYRLMDVLNAAGGVTDGADRAKAVLYHKDSSTATQIDLDALLKGDMTKNIEVQAGDTLFIPAKELGTVVITGQVRNPGERVLKTGMTIMEAVIAAGGFTPEADQRQVRVTRRDQAPIIANLEEEPTAEGVPAWQTIVLQPSDNIWVPENKELYYNMLGGFKSPGQYPLKKKINITDAITQAGGFVDRAQTNKVKLARAATANTPAQTKVIDMNKLFGGDIAQNVEIHAGDTVSVDVAGEKRSAQDVIFKDVLPVVSMILYWGAFR